MKALVKKYDTTQIEDVEIPKLDDINNVLIKVELAAICRTDLNASKGFISCPNILILGHEFYGKIVDITADVVKFKVGDKVTINPTAFGENKNLMCGVDLDGAFAEYIKVPDYLVYKLPENLSPQYSAYVEPVAASLAVINANLDRNENGCIYGDNRIAELTSRILKNYDYENILIHNQNDNLEQNKYDFIIETVSSTKDIEKIIDAIKVGGTIVLKSRQYKPVEISINSLVKKNIKMTAVSYGDFCEAIELMSSGKLNLDDLIGETYKLDDFEKAFTEAEKSESKKIYLEI